MIKSFRPIIAMSLVVISATTGFAQTQTPDPMSWPKIVANMLEKIKKSHNPKDDMACEDHCIAVYNNCLKIGNSPSSCYLAEETCMLPCGPD